jgi:hypothetical protein
MASLDGFALRLSTLDYGIVMKESGWEMNLKQAFKYLRTRSGATY